MERDRDYYSLKKDINEVKDLLGEVLRRLGSMEYEGNINYGTPNHVSDSHTKYIKLSMKRKKDNGVIDE
tara:strand:+ start:145 stop:351 length:207 start_codon:yes stop_codon:yes gene_type:complete